MGCHFPGSLLSPRLDWRRGWGSCGSEISKWSDYLQWEFGRCRLQPQLVPSSPLLKTFHSFSLDATCICTSPLPGSCDELAQGLVSLIPVLNVMFDTNYTSNRLASVIWQAQGAQVGSNCASQVVLVEVASALDWMTYPNRTLWIQTAILWNLAKSQDLAAAASMRSFVAKAPWKTLSVDGPISNASSKFQMTVSGFI